MRKTTVAMFRRFERLHDDMIRSAMPRTSAADPMPAQRLSEARAVMAVAASGARLVRPLKATLAELFAEGRQG